MTEPQCEQEMPKYKAHKEVWALQISARYENELTFEDPRYAPRLVDPRLFARYAPLPGDYYVVYADGYESISPKQAFEEGYHRIGTIISE